MPASLASTLGNDVDVPRACPWPWLCSCGLCSPDPPKKCHGQTNHVTLRCLILVVCAKPSGTRSVCHVHVCRVSTSGVASGATFSTRIAVLVIHAQVLLRRRCVRVLLPRQHRHTKGRHPGAFVLSRRMVAGAVAAPRSDGSACTTLPGVQRPLLHARQLQRLCPRRW